MCSSNGLCNQDATFKNNDSTETLIYSWTRQEVHSYVLHVVRMYYNNNICMVLIELWIIIISNKMASEIISSQILLQFCQTTFILKFKCSTYFSLYFCSIFKCSFYILCCVMKWTLKSANRKIEALFKRDVELNWTSFNVYKKQD